MLLKFKLGDGGKHQLDLDTITLDEAAWLEEDCGLGDFTELNYYNTRQLRALFAIALQRDEESTLDEAKTKVGGLANGPIFDEIRKFIEKAVRDEQAKAEKDPPTPAGSASVPAGKTNGAAGNRRAKRGARS